MRPKARHGAVPDDLATYDRERWERWAQTWAADPPAGGLSVQRWDRWGIEYPDAPRSIDGYTAALHDAGVDDDTVRRLGAAASVAEIKRRLRAGYAAERV